MQVSKILMATQSKVSHGGGGGLREQEIISIVLIDLDNEIS
jgi:hypothetical protein